MKLEGQTALVTGCRGIGRAVCRALAKGERKDNQYFIRGRKARAFRPFRVLRLEVCSNGMTEALASELSGRVMVYSVCPGAMDTEMYLSIFGDRPVLKPEHIAEKVLELALPDSNVISGSVFPLLFFFSLSSPFLFSSLFCC